MSTNPTSGNDRWGQDDGRNHSVEPESGVPWLILALVLLLMLGGGTGFMVYRTRQMQRLAVLEAARADDARQLELRRQAAEKAAKEAQEKTAKELPGKDAK
jgi:hypothetical protein